MQAQTRGQSAPLLSLKKDFWRLKDYSRDNAVPIPEILHFCFDIRQSLRLFQMTDMIRGINLLLGWECGCMNSQ